MDLEKLDINPDLKEKAKACNSPEELLALAKREGYKLTDAEMEAISGGGWGGGGKHLECPYCGENLGSDTSAQPPSCPNCGMQFTYITPD